MTSVCEIERHSVKVSVEDRRCWRGRRTLRRRCCTPDVWAGRTRCRIDRCSPLILTPPVGLRRRPRDLRCGQPGTASTLDEIDRLTLELFFAAQRDGRTLATLDRAGTFPVKRLERRVVLAIDQVEAHRVGLRLADPTSRCGSCHSGVVARLLYRAVAVVEGPQFLKRLLAQVLIITIFDVMSTPVFGAKKRRQRRRSLSQFLRLSGLALLRIVLQITVLLLRFADALLHLAFGFLRRIARGVAHRFINLALDLLSGALHLILVHCEPQSSG